jgi:D-serine deaminase-like pyridoxal phosphate-dependent protein
VAVDNADNVIQLATAASAFGSRIGVLIEVNVGLDRCGVNGKKEALDLAHMVIQQRGLHLGGLMGYEGHAMFIRDRAQRRQVCTAALDRLMGMRDALVKEGIDISVVSAGGTGTYDVTARYPGITEVQAGSYATMDATYQATVPEFEPALSVRASVISHPTSNRYVVDAGLKSVSNDMGPPHLLGHPGVHVGLLCEEHLCLSAHGTVPSL